MKPNKKNQKTEEKESSSIKKTITNRREKSYHSISTLHFCRMYARMTRFDLVMHLHRIALHFPSTFSLFSVLHFFVSGAPISLSGNDAGFWLGWCAWVGSVLYAAKISFFSGSQEEGEGEGIVETGGSVFSGVKWVSGLCLDSLATEYQYLYYHLCAP